MDDESVTLRPSYARFQIGVENRDYHHLIGMCLIDAVVSMVSAAMAWPPEADRIAVGNSSLMCYNL
jgi:hypothetical protein